MILSTNRKTKRIKKAMRDVSSSARLVTFLRTSRPSSSLEVQQINSSAFSILTTFFSGNKANLSLPITPQVKAAAFIPANFLQLRLIWPVPAPTSSFAPSHSLDKEDASDERLPSSPPWPFTLELENLQGWRYTIRINSNYLPNIN